MQQQLKPTSLHPGRTAVISLGDQVLGFLGQVHPVTAKAYDIPETYVAELNLSAIEAAFNQLLHLWKSQNSQQSAVTWPYSSRQKSLTKKL